MMHEKRPHNFKIAPRIGGLLIEVILSMAIMAVISIVFASAAKTSIGLLRHQELGSEQQIVDTTLEWVIVRSRGADQVRIINNSTLELIYHNVPSVSEQIYVRGQQLTVERGGVQEIVAEPIDRISFTDPDGRGSLVRVEITGGSNNGINGKKLISRSFAPDWLKN